MHTKGKVTVCVCVRARMHACIFLCACPHVYVYMCVRENGIGIIICCSWLDSFFWIGYKRELKHEDLFATPEEAQSQYLLERFNK